MRDWLIILAVVAIAIALIILAGNKPPGRDLSEKAATAQADTGSGPITTEAGQVITYVEYDDMTKWLSGHRNVRIVSLAGYVRSNYTRGYYVVYELPKVETK